MSAKFYPKPAQFERKSQICPNSLVFDYELSDAGMRLILVLNGIATCAPNWVACQTDLQNRLRWGVKKMRAAIKDCVNNGYLKVRQGRANGLFKPNEFEYDIDGQYPKNNDDIPEEKPPHNDCEPESPQAPTVEGSTLEEPLPYIKNEPCSVNRMLLGSDAPVNDQKKEVAFRHQGLMKDDIHSYCVNGRYDWSVDEISYAWEAFTKSIGVTDTIEYIKAIIRNRRNLSKIKKQKENEKCQKEKKQTSNTKSESLLKNNKPLIDLSKDIKQLCLEAYGTEEHPLAKFCGAPKDLKDLMRF